MPQTGALGQGWREVLDRHQAALAGDLSVRIAADFHEAVTAAVGAALAEERAQSGQRISKACEEARRTQSESLNQSLRRLRMAASERKALELLNECCGRWAERSVVLSFSTAEGGQETIATSVASTGLAGGGEVEFPLSAAPAIGTAIESRDPLVTLASGEEISRELAAAFGGGGDNDGYEKAYLFPLLSGQAPVAILIAAGDVTPAQVELLCEAAAMRIESFSARLTAAKPAASPLVRDLQWEDLSGEEQKLHLQAQRTARVRVAEMRLEHEDAFRRGQANGDLYSALRENIDGARREFLQNYLSKSATMVDYLHLEIVRSLGAGDAKLLGTGYPGPLV